jgi:hypothetical protein
LPGFCLGEARLSDQRRHFFSDALHLRQPGGVHRIGRQVERGKVAHAVLVEGPPVGQFGSRDAVARRRAVLASHEIEQLAVTRHDRLADRRPRRGSQLVPLGRAERRRGLARGIPERLEEDALVGICCQVRADRLLHPLQGDRWRQVAGLYAGAHQADVLLGVALEAFQAGDVIGVILGVIERHQQVQVGEGEVEPGCLGDRQAVSPEFQLPDLAVQQAGKDVVVQPLAGCQPGPVDGLLALAEGALLLQPGLVTAVGGVRQAVVVAVVAGSGGKERIELHPGFPMVVDQLLELDRGI